jgi:hypothetical protein
MFYYLIHNRLVVSLEPLNQFKEIGETQAKTIPGKVYFAYRKDPERFRRSFALTDISLVFLEEEGINLLVSPEKVNDYPIAPWIRKRINDGLATAVNIAYPNWQNVLINKLPDDQWRINIIGLGDVGGTLLSGLRLLGGKKIRVIGIYDQDRKKVDRWVYEANQILAPFCDTDYPQVIGISQGDIFNCDIFVFCVSAGVPPVGQEEKDVRLAQLEGNARIVKFYAQMARETGFPGIFAVMSDPVDLLCRSAFDASNRDEKGSKDYLGLAPEQIRGYGLGVMNARTAYYAQKKPETKRYLSEGRAYGPHGDGLVIANSIENYDDILSQYLTEKACKANLKVRSLGFKPYVAPALSSGALPLLATMEGKWHYSATFMGGVFMGAKNRLTPAGTELERLPLPEKLINRLQDTYERLGRYQG